MSFGFINSLSQALITEYRVITALMLRETHTIYGNSTLGYFWVVIQTVFGIGVFWGLREILGTSSPHGMPTAQFLILGFCIWYVVSGTTLKCLNAVAANKTLLTFPQVTELDVYISRTLVLWLTQVIVSIALLLLSDVVNDDLDIFAIGDLYLVIFLAPILGLGLGVTLSSFAVFLPSLERIVPLVFRVLFFASGVFFSVSTFTQNISEILTYNPILQLIELARAALYYGYPADGCSFFYVGMITIILLGMGLLLERYVRPRRKL